MDNEWKRPVVQFEEPGEDAKPGEDCKMEVDGEADRRKKLDMRKKEITKLRKIEEFKNTDEDFKNCRKKSGSKGWCRSNRDGMTCCQNTK